MFYLVSVIAKEIEETVETYIFKSTKRPTVKQIRKELADQSYAIQSGSKISFEIKEKEIIRIWQ